MHKTSNLSITAFALGVIGMFVVFFLSVRFIEVRTRHIVQAADAAYRHGNVLNFSRASTRFVVLIAKTSFVGCTTIVYVGALVVFLKLFNF